MSVAPSHPTLFQICALCFWFIFEAALQKVKDAWTEKIIPFSGFSGQ